jgi:arylformamidase
VEPAQLASLPSGRIERLLLRTGQTIAEGGFPSSWPVLDEPALRLLLSLGLRLLGVDSPSVDARTSTTLEIHKALFAAGAYNIENLDLRGVPDGEYDLIALPLKIMSIDAAPVRALLRSI